MRLLQKEIIRQGEILYVAFYALITVLHGIILQSMSLRFS